MKTYDYIIIGAGSAGCVLADKLSKNGQHNVLILEAGGTDRRFWVQVPIGYGKNFFNPKVNWMYDTEANEALGGRSVYWPRGKVLGGSSAINAMVYIRGMPHDFDDWKAAGNTGWGWDDVLPYFKELEDHPWGASDHHGTGGRLRLSDVTDDVHPLCHLYLKACKEAGFDITDDFNGPQYEGGGIYQITTHKGVRQSSANAFLRPALKRPNVDLITGAHVTRILFDGTRATGIEYHRKGSTHTVNASTEVILSGGAVNSPQLLQLSGVGPAELLKSHGIDVVADLPGVGANMQDHLGVNYYYKVNQPTLNDALGPWWGKMLQGMRYVFTRRGPLSLSINQGGGFVRGKTGSPHPDVQLYFQPVSYTQAPAGERPMMNPDPYSAIMIGNQPCRPTSRGHLSIRSSNPFAHPAIHPNYLSTDSDIAAIIDAARAVQKIVATPSMQGLITEEMAPVLSEMSDQDIIDDFRKRSGTVFHASCTCMMGPDPKTAVVDETLKVHGIQGLRVVDASIFPQVTSGNTNAPAMMVGAKGADLIMRDVN
ncbi:MAG: choline dehydrogenase [Rhodospirillales bacterium]|nr:choline dehydrogenase [Rhodospirillales bacterium]MBT7506219.1 choline dehydrogenase [Rhodospirillales bacterium]